MITLKKENVVMEVESEIQASVFLRNGYEKVGNAPAEAVPDTAEVPKEEPKRRRRKATTPE